MHSTTDRDLLKAEMAESLGLISSNRWTVETGWQKVTSQAFIHARKARPFGLDEAMVTARFSEDFRPVVKWYALPAGRPEWIECDEYSFEGFLEEGRPGLMRSTHEVRPTHCPCNKKLHRSAIRGQAFARKVAEEASTDVFQRVYRCGSNARAFHLSSKKLGSSGESIPGAYVVLSEGWNG